MTDCRGRHGSPGQPPSRAVGSSSRNACALYSSPASRLSLRRFTAVVSVGERIEDRRLEEGEGDYGEEEDRGRKRRPRLYSRCRKQLMTGLNETHLTRGGTGISGKELFSVTKPRNTMDFNSFRVNYGAEWDAACAGALDSFLCCSWISAWSKILNGISCEGSWSDLKFLLEK